MLSVHNVSMTIGNIELDDIFKKLRAACYVEGGVCATNDEGLTTDVKNIELTLGPHGSFNTPYYENMFKVLEAAVREIAVCKDYTHRTPCPNPTSYCPSKLNLPVFSLYLGKRRPTFPSLPLE